MREEVVDIISRGAAQQERAQKGPGLTPSVTVEEGAKEDREAPSGAAALSIELQVGAVAADVAERLHHQAAAIKMTEAGDVGAGMRMAPESLRDDLARAVSSNGRVDATGERSQMRTSLPAVVKRMGASLTDSVQQCLLELPCADESGMQYINPPAARKLATAAVTGQLRVADFVKETRQLLGAAAPPKESLDELREAWRLMRTALLAAMGPLSLVTATDVGLARLDARVGATASSTNVGAKCLAAWLRRVTDTWETQCVRFRQLNGARPLLADCVQRHETFLSTRTQAAALRSVLRGDHYAGAKRWRRDDDRSPNEAGGRGEQDRRPAQQPKKRRRGGRGGKTAEAGETDESAWGEEEKVEGQPKLASRCAWPDKPRLPDNKFREFRAECRKQCAEACFAFLVGSCREPSCTRSHEVPAAFEAIKRKFR